jgi:dTDP-glucose 4,6-dehydratase
MGKYIQLIQEDCANVTKNSTHLLDELRNECILVTGGTGFIGTWLAELISFLNDHYAFNTKLILLASRPNKFFSKAPHLSNRDDISFLEKDIRTIVDIPHNVTWIIHAAANPDNRLHASDPLHTTHVIVNGTDRILEACTRLPELKKFLHVSSGLIYGAQPWDIPAIPEHFPGSLDCTSFSSAYAEAKRMSEMICTVYRNQHRLPIVTVRPFAFIGPYQQLDRPWAVNNFIRDSLLGGTIRILGDGETVRSYMYPSDMSWWILNILVRGNIGRTYNIGSPFGITLKELAGKIADHYPIKPKIILNTSDKRMRRSIFVPDVTHAQKTLMLDLQVNLDEAIKRTLTWFREAQKSDSP